MSEDARYARLAKKFWVATLVGAASAALLNAGARSQSAFVDDAGRRVELPSAVGRVFAAGGPAEVLLQTLVPDKLVGRNRVPQGDAVEFFPPRYRNPVLIRRLPERNDPASDAELVRLKPDVYVDYGTVDGDYTAVVEAVQKRTGIPGIILDGELARIPTIYRRVGAALGVSSRGERLAAVAERLLERYRGVLARGAPQRVYLACSPDGFEPCLADERAGEQLAWLGGVNVAGTQATAPLRPLTLEEVKAFSARIVIVSGPPGTAARLRANREWQSIDAVAAGRVYEWPALPYSWGARPPSVNRFPGLVWLAYVAGERPFDDAFTNDIREIYREFYRLDLTDAQLQRLLRQ